MLLASKPGVRAFIPKRTLVDMGMNKRTMHSELWTQDVAKAFGKLLRGGQHGSTANPTPSPVALLTSTAACVDQFTAWTLSCL